MSFDKYKGYIGLAVILTILVTAAIFFSWKNYKDKFGTEQPPKEQVKKQDTIEESTPTPEEKSTEGEVSDAGAAKNPEPTKTVKPDKDLEKYAAEITAAKQLEAEKKLLEAKKLYESLLPSFNNPATLQKEIYRLNIAMLFSPQQTAPPDGPKTEFYTVAPKDTVEGIAKKFNTTVDLIKESNGIKDVKTIQIGNRFKVVNDQFSIIVSRSKNTLTLLAGDIVMKEYTVGTGEYDKTPLGDFKIRNKIPEPPWKGIPYGDPKNVLGTRWMGLVNEGDTVPGYGIHGTWEPETVGKSVSQGCIRMVNEEVEELYKIMPVGAKVKIIE
jgi:lipoprotein-anchoring transpeptidase ErfK/SrfK